MDFAFNPELLNENFFARQQNLRLSNGAPSPLGRYGHDGACQ